MKKIIFIIPFVLLFLHVMYAVDGPNMWTQSLTGSGQIWGISVCTSNQQVVYAASNSAGIYKTTNGGLNWAPMNSGLLSTTLQVVAVAPSNPDIVYCGTGPLGSNAGVYRSSNGGANWTAVNTGIVDTLGINGLAVSPTDPNTVFVAVWNASNFTNSINGLYKTTNGGTTWVPSNTGMGTNKNTITLAINPLNANVIYAGTSFLVPNPPGTGPTFIYKSVNGGTSWTSMSSGLPTGTTDINPIRDISISTLDTAVVMAGLFFNTATANGGVYLTTNGGLNWVQRISGLPSTQATLIRSCLIRPGTNSEFYIGMDGGTATLRGVYRTTNAGLQWTPFNAGTMLNTYTVRALKFRTLADSTLYAGVAGTAGGQGVHEYTWIPVGINGNNGQVPKDFALYQNYPNPFNPATNIQFDIPKESFVSLKVFDIRGKEVKTLVNENRQAGTYYITFDASSLASGVYFYKLSAHDYTKTMKMVLVK